MGGHSSGLDPSGSRQVHSSMTRPHGTASGTRPMLSVNPLQNGNIIVHCA